jgi:ubiquinol-cytochrome c reductase cytochrome c subunit
MRISLAILTLFVGVAVACVPAKATVAQESGRDLYALNCASCHGATARGSNVAPSLVGKSAADVHFVLDTGRMPSDLPYGSGEIHRASRFTEPQMTALVRYVESFSPHPDSALPLVYAGNPIRGRALFAENCAPCHGAAGTGASVGYASVAPSLTNATVFQVDEAIRAGPEMMPRFGPDVLSDRDVSDIAFFVNYLQTQGNNPKGPDAGGISLGRVGPVAEGLIGWLFGIGALVLFARAIGTTE